MRKWGPATAGPPLCVSPCESAVRQDVDRSGKSSRPIHRTWRAYGSDQVPGGEDVVNGLRQRVDQSAWKCAMSARTPAAGGPRRSARSASRPGRARPGGDPRRRPASSNARNSSIQAVVGVLGDEVVEEAVGPLRRRGDDRADREVRPAGHDVDRRCSGRGGGTGRARPRRSGRRPRAARSRGGLYWLVRPAFVSRRYASGETSIDRGEPGCAIGQW